MNEITPGENFKQKISNSPNLALGAATAALGTAFGVGKTFSVRKKYKKIAQLNQDAFEGAKIPRSLKKYNNYTKVTTIADYISKQQFKKLPARILGFTGVFAAIVIGAKVYYNQHKEQIQGFFDKFRKNKTTKEQVEQKEQIQAAQSEKIEQPAVEKQAPIELKTPEQAAKIVSNVMNTR